MLDVCPPTRICIEETRYEQELLMWYKGTLEQRENNMNIWKAEEEYMKNYNIGFLVFIEVFRFFVYFGVIKHKRKMFHQLSCN